MKRFGIISGLALAALALTNCAKEVDTTKETIGKKDGVPFSIIAMPSDETKTIAGDNMSTLWDANNDKLNVFHKLTSGDDFTSDGEFSVANATTGTFSGTISENVPTTGNNYDWAAIYPYDSDVSSLTPSGTGFDYYYVGGRSDRSQAQNGTGSTAHLAGYGYYGSGDDAPHRGFPLWGKTKNVPYSASGEGFVSPVISMNQVCSVLAFNIKNSTNAEIKVSRIEFTATEDIVGTYYIDFSGDTPVFTKYKTYQSETVSLDVTNGTIAAGSTGLFYAGIKPFTVEGTDAAPKTLSMTVYTEGGESQTKEFSVKKTMSFLPNKYKNVNMEFETEHQEPTDPADYNWVLCKDADALALGDEIVIAATTSNFAMSTTQTNNNRSHTGITKDGDNLTATSNVQVLILVNGTKDNTFGLQCVNGDEAGKYLYASGTSSNLLKSSDTLTDQGSWTISIDSAGKATIKAQGTNERNWMRYNNLFACYKNGQKDVSIYTKGASTDSDTKSIISNGTLAFPAVGGSELFTSAYTTSNIESTETINVTSSENITNVTISNGTVTFSMNPNYTGSKVNGTITLTLASDNTVTTTIPVEQNSSSLVVSSDTVIIPSDATTASFTVTSKEFGFSIEASTNVSASPASSDASESAVTITVSSSVSAITSEAEIGTVTISRTTDDPQEKTVTIKKAAQAETGTAWVRTAITSLSAGDLIVIVDVTSDRAMSNDKGTGNPPLATPITLVSDKSRLSSEPATNLQWVFGGNVTDGYTFNVSGTDTYLYCNNTNNGVRVGKSENKTFTIDSDFLKNSATSRFIGVYNNQDWRCYTTTTGNIASTEVAFYKKTGGSSGGTVWDLKGISITTPPTKTAYYAGESFDPTGMVVTASYEELGNTSNTKTETIAIADLTFSPSSEDALAVSNTSVTVSYSEGGTTKTATQTITVNKATPTLAVTPASPITAYVGSTVQLSVEGTDGDISYSSNNTSKATVSSDGLITGVAEGSATITINAAASANYNAASTTVTVNISARPPYSQTYTGLNLTPGDGSSAVTVVIDEKGYDGIKLGTSKKAGSMTFEIPVGTTKIHFHAIGWKDENTVITISGAIVSPSSVTTTQNSATGNAQSTFYVTTNSSTDYFVLQLQENITSSRTITFSTGGMYNRCVVWGVNAE